MRFLSPFLDSDRDDLIRTHVFLFEIAPYHFKFKYIRYIISTLLAHVYNGLYSWIGMEENYRTNNSL
jgi:hypothetical protein